MKKNIHINKINVSKILFFFSLLYFIITTFKFKKSEIRRSKDIFFPHKIYIESHRGANIEFFENTMKSFKKAMQYKADSIETDVWLTKDNVLVLLHASSREGNLFYYYDHPGNVINLTWSELSTFRTIQGNSRMPRLSDLMEIAKNKIYINLEVKDKRIDIVFPHIIKIIEKYDFFDQISLSSPFFEYYNKVQEYNNHHYKKLYFGFIYDRNQSMYFDYSHNGTSLNIHWADATKEVCDRAHKNGVAIVAWIDIFEEEHLGIYKFLIDNGVDVICCNKPKQARRFLNKYYINK